MTDGGSAAPAKARTPWKWGALHALLWLVLVIGAAALAAASGRVANPEKFGEGIGRLSLFLLLAGFASGYLLAQGKQTGARVIQVLLGIAVVAIAVLPFVIGKGSGPERLTEQERQELVETPVDGVTRLQHPYLGFSIAHPGPGFTTLDGQMRTQIERVWANQPDLFGGGWQQPATGEFLLVVFGKGLESREDLVGFSNGLRSSLVGQFDLDVLNDEIVWEGETREARYEASASAGVFIALRAVVDELGPEGETFVVVLIAMTAQRGTLDHVLQSFSAS